jgi:hypothetical protein
MLYRLESISVPQADELGTGFGRSGEPPADRFPIALAALSRLSEVVGELPLIYLIVDQQWLDSASAQILAFAARRLGAQSEAWCSSPATLVST